MKPPKSAQMKFTLRFKIDYENILNNKTEGAILRSKTRIYEKNEKSSKYFLNLEKQSAVRNTIKMLKKSPEIDSSITNPKEITKEKIEYAVRVGPTLDTLTPI